MKIVAQRPDAGSINVRLVLAGGHALTLNLPPDHPLLARLFAAIAAERIAPNESACFQFPMEGGRASLAFAGQRLVAVVTDPAVTVETGSAQLPEAEPASPGIAAAVAASQARGHRDVIRHAVVQLESFLSDADVQWLMGMTFAAEHRFVPSRLSSHRPDYRDSLMLPAPHGLWAFMTGRIKAVLPDVMQGLNIGGFPIGNIDCQITASVDGSYFKAHTDAGRDGPIKRQLSYVYYFNREPKGFTGGELRIYDDVVRNGKLSSTDTFQVIEPRHNSIVFFQSAIMHEVMPVSMPSKQFRDARFTVNGWVERA
jgi:Rps23 Pro-64 3,4-dihydroxylase Tpa1-like proline 4-hydroxylase